MDNLSTEIPNPSIECELFILQQLLEGTLLKYDLVNFSYSAVFYIKLYIKTYCLRSSA